jgi:nicotinate-nucleotide pyrophosphorylase (carboxylating)
MHFQMTPHIRSLVDSALDEDRIGFDISSAAFEPGDRSEARLVAKEPMVLAGWPVLEQVFATVDSDISWEKRADEGARLQEGDVLGEGEGPTASLLRGERVALNFLQRMSGVATKTARFVDALDDPTTQIVDTRKTLPGWRELDKYAVRCGGGSNHRFDLGGGAMIKDNHIAAAGGIAEAVDRVRRAAPFTLKIEVECERLDQIRPAMDAGADIIMLDNMSTEEMADAIDSIRGRAGDRVIIEASGNITVERLPQLRGLGLDVISSGALTHSATAADISMRM